MIKHILIATDGSELSNKAAMLGGDLARALNARVSVLEVLDDQTVVSMAWGGVETGTAGTPRDLTVESVRRQIEQDARANDLATTAAAVGKLPAPPELACVWGHAVSEICDYAEQNAVDLIVIGSHGRTGIKAALLGSVSHAVANRAPCAVMISR